MTPTEAKQISGRSETWLRYHKCAWCGATLWMALTSGCRAIHDKCDPAQKDFSKGGKLNQSTGIREI